MGLLPVSGVQLIKCYLTASRNKVESGKDEETGERITERGVKRRKWQRARVLKTGRRREKYDREGGGRETKEEDGGNRRRQEGRCRRCTVHSVRTRVNEVWFPRGVTLSVALFLQVNGDYHKAGPLRWTPGHAPTHPHTHMYTNTHTHTQPDVWSRWNMDPNGCVPSLKGLGVDLSTVKQLVQLPRGGGEGGGGSQVWIRIPVGNT